MKLGDLLSTPLPTETVSSTLSTQSWQIHCSIGLDTFGIQNIQEVAGLLNQKDDQCVWLPSSDGKFRLKSTWEI